MKEDYVSFETAKLLKEKGFDELCYACYEYFESGVTLYKGWPFEYKGEPVHNTNNRVKCPTLQMATKWLREVHNICIVISCDVCDSFEFYTTIYIKGENSWITYEDYQDSGSDDYKQVADSAIEYCLTNLI